MARNGTWFGGKVRPSTSDTEQKLRQDLIDRIHDRIVSSRIRPQQIQSRLPSYRACMHSQILQRQYECFSLRRALQIAEAVGVTIKIAVAA